jgi:DNA polymerase iota
VGNVNKPKNQTILAPPYLPIGAIGSSVTQFLDSHDIGKIPGVGFKLAQKIRAKVLGRQPAFDERLVYSGTRESTTVWDVRSYPSMGPEMLEDILGGPGAIKGIGGKVWDLIHGIDDSEVGKVKRVPSQISQEDSYMKYLHTFEEVKKQLRLLGERLIRRMHMDLLEEDMDRQETKESPQDLRWMAHPRTLRLSTRPRPPVGPDGVRARTFQRISRSAPMPNFIFNLTEAPDVLAERLVEEVLVPMFRKLHHDKPGWDLSLINVAATNMAETAAESKDSSGRDIGKMFRNQDEVLKEFKVTDPGNQADDASSSGLVNMAFDVSNDPAPDLNPNLTVTEGWDSDDSDAQATERCAFCHASIPSFALVAHQRYHELNIE